MSILNKLLKKEKIKINNNSNIDKDNIYLEIN